MGRKIFLTCLLRSSVQFLLTLLATVLRMDLNTVRWCDDRTSKYSWLSVDLEKSFVFKKTFSTYTVI